MGSQDLLEPRERGVEHSCDVPSWPRDDCLRVRGEQRLAGCHFQVGIDGGSCLLHSALLFGCVLRATVGHIVLSKEESRAGPGSFPS